MIGIITYNAASFSKSLHKMARDSFPDYPNHSMFKLLININGEHIPGLCAYL